MINPNQVYEFRPIEDTMMISRQRKGFIGNLTLSRLTDNQAYQIELDKSGVLSAREISPFEVMLTLDSLDFVGDEICA